MMDFYQRSVISDGTFSKNYSNWSFPEENGFLQERPDFDQAMKLVSHNLPIILYQIDLCFLKIDWVTPQAFEQMGYSEEDLEHPNELFLNSLHPEDSSNLLSGLEHFVQNPATPNKGMFRIKDKNECWKQFGYIMKLKLSEGKRIPLKALGMAIDTTRENNYVVPSIPKEKLSPREKEVLTLIVEGLNDKEIAERLFISSFTAESHRKNILKKIHAKNTASLVRIAITEGLIY